MIIEIFKDSLEYSTKNKKRILKLGILTFISIIFLLPLILLQGYSYRIITIGVKGVINGDDPLPRFSKIGNMLVDGIKVLFVRFVYLLPGTIIAILFLVGNLAQFASSNITYNVTAMNTFNQTVFTNIVPIIAKNAVISSGFISIAIILWIIFYLISDIAIVHMAENKGSISYAFRFNDIIDIIKSIGVFEYITIYLGMLILLSGVIFTSALILGLCQSILATIVTLLSTSFIVGSAISGLFVGIIAIFLLIFVLIPVVIIFKSRIMALVYNMR